MTVLDKAVAQELEFLRADLELLRLEVDSLGLDMRRLKPLVSTIDMTLKHIIARDFTG